MKNKILLIVAIVLGLNQITQAQVATTVDCDMMSLSVSASDTNYVNLYHPGHYLTWPRDYNIIAWDITDTQGNIILQDTLIDEAFYFFYHSISIADIMNITAHLWNDSAIAPNGNLVNCLIEDQLHWELTEIIPGFPFGNWDILNDNVGVDMNTSLGIDDITLDNKKLIKIVDFLGRETKGTKNEVLFHIYNDGTVEKKIVIE